MAERGITLIEAYPKPLTNDVVHAADVIVTMGCGDACPIYPGKRHLDWEVPDPNGSRSTESVTFATTYKPASPHSCATSPSKQTQGDLMADKSSVLFVCVHNAGRSQIAAGYLSHLAGGRIEVRSAGSELADKINPVAVQAMAEEGIDIAAEQLQILTTEAVQGSNVRSPWAAATRATNMPANAMRTGSSTTQQVKTLSTSDIRDEIKRRVAQLIGELN